MRVSPLGTAHSSFNMPLVKVLQFVPEVCVESSASKWERKKGILDTLRSAELKSEQEDTRLLHRCDARQTPIIYILVFTSVSNIRNEVISAGVPQFRPKEGGWGMGVLPFLPYLHGCYPGCVSTSVLACAQGNTHTHTEVYPGA